MNKLQRDTIREKTSHCMNCGVVVRPSVKEDEYCNNEFCAVCGPLAARLIEGEMRGESATEALIKAVVGNAPEGVLLNQYAMTKKDQIEAKRTQRVILDQLLERKEAMRSEILRQTGSN